MFIESFRIDGFGIFANVQVSQLSPGLSIFLGSNEAGKSTCLEFLRTMLTGYRRRSKNERDVSPLRGGQPGGGLVLRTSGHGLLHLTRRPGAGNLTLARPDGSNVPSTLLDNLLAGVTHDVYRTVFGFSLDELQALGSLDAEGIRNALYNASFGAGLRAPGVVLQQLDKQMGELFKSSGKKPALNIALDNFALLQEDLQKTVEEYASYDRHAQELAQLREQLETLRIGKQQLDVERRKLDRRLSAWDQWQAWREVGLKLERLPAINGHFPQNGALRMESILKDYDICQQQVAAHEAKWQRIVERLQAMILDTPLLEALPALRRLAELKGSFRQAGTQLPGQEDNLASVNNELQLQLQRLGPDWDCERIRHTDRSLVDREDMDRLASDMVAAESSYKATVDALNRVNREVADAESNVSQVQAELEAMPSPEAELDDNERDALRQQLARYEDGLRQIPEDEHELETTRTAFRRIWDPLRLAPTTSANEPREELDRLLQHQDEALSLADEVQQCIEESNEANKAVVQAQEAADAVKNRLDALLRTQQSGTPTREALSAKSNALRQLRGVASALRGEKERLEDIQGRLESTRRPTGISSIPLIVVGILLCLVGASILVAHMLLGISAYALSPTLEVPVNLWSGYLVLVCGVAFLGGGLPRSGPEAKHYKQEMESLRSRLDTSTRLVQEKEAHARELCATAHIDDWHEETLAACEETLEQERERCFREERTLEEMATIKQEQAVARTQLSMTQTKAHEKDALVQQTRRRWHEFMLGLKVGNVPAPDAAHKFFAHVESARIAVDGLVQANDKLERHTAEMQRLGQELADLPPVAERLADEGEPTSQSLLDAIHAVLEACREADNARDRRLQAEAQLRAHEGELARAQNRQAELAEELRAKEAKRTQTTEAWGTKLQSIGLGLDLAPDTVREAFKCMDDSLALEAEVGRIKAAIAQSRKDMDALTLPLQELLEKLGRTSSGGHDSVSTDWLAMLDAVMTDAEAMLQTQTERQQLARQAEEAEDDLRASQATLADVGSRKEALLALAACATLEDFMHMAAIVAETDELLRRRQELEDQLSLATDEDLTLFLSSFENVDREEEEARLGQMDAQLADISREEDGMLTRIGELTARVATLRDGNSLASQQQDASEQEAHMATLARQWARLAMTHAVIEQTKRQFERERQPAVMQEASKIFRLITDGRWQGINASLENSGGIRILPANQGEPVGPEMLSRGAQEQAYLALRLAYIKNHAAQAEALPLVMDDVLVNFDPERAQRTASALARLSGANDGLQILYFTCHPHMVDILRAAQPDAPLYTVADGSISRESNF